MSKTWLLILILIQLGLSLPSEMQGQFIRFQMEVETELNAKVVQDFQFGDIFPGSGLIRIEKGSDEMGIFSIRGLTGQQLRINLDPPSHLESTIRTVDARIPVSLQAAYVNGGPNDVDRSIPFSENTARFTLGGQDLPVSASNWEVAYIYIYGTINVGKIPPGVYEGFLTLTIDYQ